MEDVCSLEKFGALKSGTLSDRFVLFAEYVQMALALVEVGVTYMKVQRQRTKLAKLAKAAQEAEAKTKAAQENEHIKAADKMTLVKLELLKYFMDIGKALYDCELNFSSEGVFIVCGLTAAVLSTHKNVSIVFDFRLQSLL